MAVFRCKMCGGELNVLEGQSVIQCEYCGTKQTLPRLNDDRRSALYDRANHFRRNNNFDKAMEIYEQILNEDPSDAEAYWSLVLCSYGIEYVHDPYTGSRKPTINRIQYTSVFDDDNYKSALRYADPMQSSVYQEEARAINEIQKNYLAISQKAAPFDIFICYKESDENNKRTPDSVLAQELYYGLTDEGFRVFFARVSLENKLGSAYEPYIFSALNSAKVMVVLGTKPEYFNAVWVKNEWSRFLALIKNGQKKVLIPAYRDMDAYYLPEEFSHLQAQDMSKLGFMQDLIRGIKKIIGAPEQTKKESFSGNEKISPLLKRIQIFLEEGSFQEANEYCERVLDLDPENSDAYLFKLMAHFRVFRVEDLASVSEPLDSVSAYRMVLRFSDAKTAALITEYNRIVTEKIQNAQRLKEQERLQREEQLRQEQARRQQEEHERAEMMRRQAEAFRLQKEADWQEEQARIQIQNEQSRLQANKNREEALREERKKYLSLGWIFIIFFWPIGIYFFFKAKSIGKELDALLQVKTKRRNPFVVFIGIVSLLILCRGVTAEIENLSQGVNDPIGLSLCVLFAVLAFLCLKKRK